MKVVARVILAALVLTAPAGCSLEDVKEVFTQPLRRDGKRRAMAGPRDRTPPPAEVEAEPLPPHAERDPVRPAEKRQMGIHYDPTVFEQGAYRPDQLENMITSQGYDGLSQQTFAETGGDFDVHLNRAGDVMLFSTTRYGHTADIVVQSITGRAVTLHTTDPADDLMPEFSPDVNHVAWCSNRYGNMDILVSPTNRTERTRPNQVTRSTEDEIHPTWSPDAVWPQTKDDPGQGLLAFARYSSMDGVWRLWVMDIRTRSLSAITEGIFPVFKPMAETRKGPDGKEETLYTLLYQKHRKRDIPFYSIWTIQITMNARGKVEVANSPTEIVASDKWAAINPTWSPDGRYIAFASVRKSPISQWQARIYRADDVWVVKTDGTDLTQVTSHAAPDWNPCWARDPDDPESAVGRLYFHSLRSGTANVWSVSPVVAGMMR